MNTRKDNDKNMTSDSTSESTSESKDSPNRLMEMEGIVGNIISQASFGGAQFARVNRLFRRESVAELKDATQQLALSQLSAEELCKAGEASEATAMLILKIPGLLDKLGRDNPNTLFNIGERVLNISPETISFYTGDYISRIGKAHMNAARYIQANLMDRITSSMREGINEKINPRQRFYFGGGCTI